MIAARPGCGRAGRDGFALLVTLTLLAFIVILFTGLATFTRIETAIAGNSLRQAQARQNALFALDAAISQLQAHAGPDQRVTATAATFGGRPGAGAYTGVWDTTTSGRTPKTWLVSGNELDPLAIVPTEVASAAVELVGRNSSGLSNDVVAPLVDLAAPSEIDGTSSASTIGRYAWWVGDCGVKAPIASGDRSKEVNYGPFASVEARSRLPQQIGRGSASTAFEPHDPANAAKIRHVMSSAQVAWLVSADRTPVGEAVVRENFHAWTTDNRAVLANTKLGGLRQDLSRQPDLLGAGFAAWADYAAYMERPETPDTPAPLPEYDADWLRRRYRIRPAVSEQPGVAPVLTYFYLLLGVRKQNAAAPYTVSLRWAAALWNPYTSALVPEDLRLEIAGLPTSIDFVAANTNAVNASASLPQLYGEPLKVTLPWTATTPSARPDRHSWLPGRVYNWVNQPGASLAVDGENPGRFYSRDLGGFADGLLVNVPGTAAVNGSTPLSLRLNSSVTLTIRLVRARDGALLATYQSPTYEAVESTAPDDASKNKSQFGFLFRLAESFDTVANPSLWLTTDAIDPRSAALPALALRAVPNGPNPAAYVNYVTISAPDRFFDRDITRGTSYNEDVPLFELPRAPILSLGALQHLFVPGARPFAIGNAWGAAVELNGFKANEVFDRFFFSGLTDEVSAVSDGQGVLPNAWLRPTSRSTALSAIAAAPNASATQLLQHGAFNANSTQREAWLALLRAGRTIEGVSFSYLDAAPATGTAGDDNRLTDATPGARFFRFAQSAQEVFKADANYAQSTTSTTATGPTINTALFRRGMRTLSAAELEAFAEALVAAIRLKHAGSGPYRSMEEFVNPAAELGSRSAIEQAIADAGLNEDVAEFSSQWLTQGDVLATLAPFLFVRSDTFLIRAYGEAVNSATETTEGRAWCEAVVQRMPDYFDPAEAPETAPLALAREANQRYGRRFRVTSFRWLTRSDI